MDFSENISQVPQDEIESAHFTTKQVTLHPVHVVRNAADSTPEEPNIINKSLVILSDSLSHNADAVFAFTKHLLTHIRDNPGPCPIRVLHRFTDNCACQYKCKSAFAHIGQQLEAEHYIRVIYHFTESGHGKGPSDGIGAAIKMRLQRLILGERIVNNAYEAYLALAQTQNHKLNKKIVYIPQRKLRRTMPQKLTIC